MQFLDRKEIKDAGLHAHNQAGISGTKVEGADAIVLSSGYPDDEDHGDYIIYTGEGGQDPSSRKQIANQDPDSSGNAGLITSAVAGLPVRVFRGARHRSPYSPPSGYRYAGLFLVSLPWPHRRPDGFTVLRFRLDRLPEQDDYVAAKSPERDIAFATSTISRRIRDTALTRKVKELYQHSCQVCATQIRGLRDRPYAEGAHVRPLGRPHDGADTLNNILCLCANHHVEFDIGGTFIADDLSLVSSTSGNSVGKLLFIAGHELDLANARYHREKLATI